MIDGRFTIGQLVGLAAYVWQFYKAFRTYDDAARKRGFNSFDTAKEMLEEFAAVMRDKALIKKDAPTKAEQTSFDRASGGTSG